MQVIVTVPPRDQNSTFHSSHTHLTLQQMAPEVPVAPRHRSPAVLSSLTDTSLWQGTSQTGACSSLREETQQGHLSAANHKSRNRECGMDGWKWEMKPHSLAVVSLSSPTKLICQMIFRLGFSLKKGRRNPSIFALTVSIIKRSVQSSRAQNSKYLLP